VKIAAFESLHADAGGRAFDYLKATTDDGLVGWSEYNESFGALGVSATIDRLAPVLIGKDPRAFEAHVAVLQALRRPSAGGIVQQAIGAIENALLDLKARALGVRAHTAQRA
jgi:galactonate dehydratase